VVSVLALQYTKSKELGAAARVEDDDSPAGAEGDDESFACEADWRGSIKARISVVCPPDPSTTSAFTLRFLSLLFVLDRSTSCRRRGHRPVALAARISRHTITARMARNNTKEQARRRRIVISCGSAMEGDCRVGWLKVASRFSLLCLTGSCDDVMTGRGTRSSDRFENRSIPIYVKFLYRVDVNHTVAEKRRITC
jgi:hypothetical protein